MAKPGQWLPDPLAKELLTMQGDQFRPARSVDTECLAVIPEAAPLLQLVRDGLAQQPRGLTLDQVRRTRSTGLKALAQSNISLSQNVGGREELVSVARVRRVASAH
jgi:hypothetical protein